MGFRKKKLGWWNGDSKITLLFMCMTELVLNGGTEFHEMFCGFPVDSRILDSHFDPLDRQTTLRSQCRKTYAEDNVCRVG